MIDRYSYQKYEKLFLIAIIIIAFIFRFQDLFSIPPGLYPDEAINGNDALKALDSGNFKVFYPENNGREGLHINLIALSFKIFGKEIWAIRIVSAIFGFLTVIGIYLLVRQTFNWQIALISSFYLAISFWHTNFSRIGFSGILVPFFLVFGFYFLWRGIQRLDLKNFALSGLAFGLGLQTYIAFRFAPLIVILFLATYWWKIKKDYNKEEYFYLRNKLIRGFTILFLVALFSSLPILIYFWQNPQDFFGRASQVSIFSANSPFKEFLKSFFLNLISFNFVGDFNWRHNFSSAPLLFLPIGIFFLVGLIKNIIKIGKKWRTHRHPSTLPLFLFAWFLIMILPAALTREGIPHALRLIGVIPVAIIFSAEGTWWLFQSLIHLQREKDIHPLESPYKKEKEAELIVGIALIIFLASIGIHQYNQYFDRWAKRQEVKDAFSTDLVELGEKINQLPIETPKYVIVNLPGGLVDTLNPFDPQEKVRGIPMPTQTVMFVTKSYSPRKQEEKKIFYILPGEEKFIEDKNSMIFTLNQNF